MTRPVLLREKFGDAAVSRREEPNGVRVDRRAPRAIDEAGYNAGRDVQGDPGLARQIKEVLRGAERHLRRDPQQDCRRLTLVFRRFKASVFEKVRVGRGCEEVGSKREGRGRGFSNGAGRNNVFCAASRRSTAGSTLLSWAGLFSLTFCFHILFSRLFVCASDWGFLSPSEPRSLFAFQNHSEERFMSLNCSSAHNAWCVDENVLLGRKLWVRFGLGTSVGFHSPRYLGLGNSSIRPV